MWIRICLAAFFLTTLASADQREAYDRIRDEIRETRRTLNEAHSQRDYVEATRLQKQIRRLLEEALKTGRETPDVSQASLWNFQADTLRDIGYPDEALRALENYLKTPLLDRNGFRNAWKKRGRLHQRMDNSDKARRAWERALTFADPPQERLAIQKELAQLALRNSDQAACYALLQQMESSLKSLDNTRRLRAAHQLESLKVRAYRKFGDADLARTAKKQELLLKKQLLEHELESFEANYPVYEAVAEH